MDQYIKKMKMLFRRQPSVSISQDKEEISVCIDYADVGENAGEWMRSAIATIEHKIPELEQTDYGCHEIVYLKFKEKEEVRKQQLTHEIIRFLLEEPESGGTYVDVDFLLKENGLEDYLEYYFEKDTTVFLEYNFHVDDNQPRLLIEGKWVKPVHEEYDSFEKRMRETLDILSNKIKSEIKNTPNWETLSNEDPIREKILDKYAIQEEPYSEESEKKLENIRNQ